MIGVELHLGFHFWEFGYSHDYMKLNGRKQFSLGPLRIVWRF